MIDHACRQKHLLNVTSLFVSDLDISNYNAHQIVFVVRHIFYAYKITKKNETAFKLIVNRWYTRRIPTNCKYILYFYYRVQLNGENEDNLGM